MQGGGTEAHKPVSITDWLRSFTLVEAWSTAVHCNAEFCTQWSRPTNEFSCLPAFVGQTSLLNLKLLRFGLLLCSVTLNTGNGCLGDEEILTDTKCRHVTLSHKLSLIGE